jgi:hypothetical protein
VTVGWCVNTLCARAAAGEPIERYPGPGEYCPECGEKLQSETAAAPEPKKTARFKPNRAVLIGSVVAAFGVAAVAGAFGARVVPAFNVRVCDSTMTARAAREIVRTYSSHASVWPYHYTVSRAGNLPCDVRFLAAPAASSPPDAKVIAHDGVVAVVNPANPVAQLSIPELRGILSGNITDWAQAGGRQGAIVAAVPDGSSDEAHELDATVMQGQAIGRHVIRDSTADKIVRFVSSPSGMRAIGIVPFSGALPAKVVAIAGAAVPSLLSIGADRYPMSMHILVASDFRAPSRPASALLGFTLSDDADDLLARTAAVAKKGP